MTRKVFISVLGATDYGVCDYQKDGVSYGKVRFIQEATLTYLFKEDNWSDYDCGIILLTKKAEEKNWIDNGQLDKTTKQPKQQAGLKTCLSKFNIPIKAVTGLPDGNNEKEIWEIFERAFQEIEKGDELYFDITHGYRYIPMLILVLCNYAKFLSDVKIKSITYGNYEISERGTKPGIIVDLLPLTQLQDWTFAAADYIRNGNVQDLSELNTNDSTLSEFTESLVEVIGERQTCRGIDIIKTTNFNRLLNITNNIESTSFKPLNPIMQKIKESFEQFDAEENIRNGYNAAIWCFDNKLYQQSITILQETIISDICINNNLDWQKRKYRDYVTSAFYILEHNTPKSGWQSKEEKDTPKWEEEMGIIDKLINSEITKCWINLYSKVEDLRNDINHSGMRDNAKTISEFITLLTNCITELKKKIESC